MTVIELDKARFCWSRISPITIPGEMVTRHWRNDPKIVREYFWWRLHWCANTVAVAYFG